MMPVQWKVYECSVSMCSEPAEYQVVKAGLSYFKCIFHASEHQWQLDVVHRDHQNRFKIVGDPLGMRIAGVSNPRSRYYR